MTESSPSAATSALSELLEVSPQVDAAVILERDGGRLVASAPASVAATADRFATTCSQMLDAGEQSRTELGREPVSQIEVATRDGHVFVVADANWIVAAVTDADPTVGLVFYDLKTALRTVRDARMQPQAADVDGDDGSEELPAPSSARIEPVAEVDVDVPDEETFVVQGLTPVIAEEEDPDDGDEHTTQPISRWRRRKS